MRRRFRFAGLAALASCWVLLAGAGCSSSGGAGSPSCRAFCGDFCGALARCAAPAAGDCKAQCELGAGEHGCADAPPADRLTCAELLQSYACVDYCATLCTRAPSCGSFDPASCATGCAYLGAPICNAASVAARSCDQLKPELRLYEEAAQALREGDELIHIGSGPMNGLCRTGQDCLPPLGCSAQTNTCGACEADVDCTRQFETYICSAEKQCTAVSCASDTDCALGFCNLATHECGDCRSSADCQGVFKACEPVSATCVECLSDAECTREYAARCEVGRNRCVECLSNADCTSSFSPRCDQQTKSCGACETNADCTAPGRPVCSYSECVGCVTDLDCKDPARPGCDGLRRSCVPCTRDEHCPGGTCDAIAHVCR